MLDRRQSVREDDPRPAWQAITRAWLDDGLSRAQYPRAAPGRVRRDRKNCRTKLRVTSRKRAARFLQERVAGGPARSDSNSGP